MQYRKRDTGEIVSRIDLRAKNPNTSFPEVWNQDTFDLLNVDPVEPSPPIYNPETETVEVGAPVFDTVWRQTWKVIQLPPDVIASRKAAATQQHNSAIKQQIAEIERGQARAIREAALTGETSYLAQIELQIVNLRAQLQ